MKIDAHLDYATILQNQARPVHLALRLQAPVVAETGPRRPMAFCAVLDRSGSMGGAPLHRAKAACESVIRNLRAEDQFALVTFDDRAEVVIPMQTVADRPGAIEAVRRIGERGMKRKKYPGHLQLAGLLHLGRVIVVKHGCQNRSVYD